MGAAGAAGSGQGRECVAAAVPAALVGAGTGAVMTTKCRWSRTACMTAVRPAPAVADLRSGATAAASEAPSEAVSGAASIAAAVGGIWTIAGRRAGPDRRTVTGLTEAAETAGGAAEAVEDPHRTTGGAGEAAVAAEDHLRRTAGAVAAAGDRPGRTAGGTARAAAAAAAGERDRLMTAGGAATTALPETTAGNPAADPGDPEDPLHKRTAGGVEAADPADLAFPEDPLRMRTAGEAEVADLVDPADPLHRRTAGGAEEVAAAVAPLQMTAGGVGAAVVTVLLRVTAGGAAGVVAAAAVVWAGVDLLRMTDGGAGAAGADLHRRTAGGEDEAPVPLRRTAGGAAAGAGRVSEVAVEAGSEMRSAGVAGVEGTAAGRGAADRRREATFTDRSRLRPAVAVSVQTS